MSLAGRIWMVVSGLFVLLGILIFLGPVGTANAVTLPVSSCPPGTRPITSEADLKLAKETNPQATIGTCWDSKNSTTGADVGEAKQYLTSVLKGGSCGPYRTTADGLDSKFAICAARFVKDLRARDPSFYVASMYRSTPHQAYLCGGGCGIVNGPCAAAGSSRHQQGLAIDVSNGQRIVPDWVHQMGLAYGVVFSVNGDSGHFQPRPGSNCADPNFRPPNIQDLVARPPFDQALRRLLQPASAPPPIQSTSPAPTQPILAASPPIGVVNTTVLPPGTCIPQFYCSGSTYYYRSSACVDQMYQTCQYGCADSTTCAANPRSASSTNQNTNTNTNSTGTSTYDLIGGYVTSSATEIATATPITLNPNTSRATVLQPPPPSVAYGPGGAIGVSPSPSQETFTSSDLSNSLPYGQPQSAYSATLNRMKNIVLNLLSYLRPFGGGVPSQVYAD